MHRRDFVAGSLGASIVPALGQTAARERGRDDARWRPPPPASRRSSSCAGYQFRMGPMVARYARVREERARARP